MDQGVLESAENLLQNCGCHVQREDQEVESIDRRIYLQNDTFGISEFAF